MPEEVSIKSTKNEILDAYNNMLKKVKQLEKEKPAQSREAEERKETVVKAKEVVVTCSSRPCTTKRSRSY